MAVASFSLSASGVAMPASATGEGVNAQHRSLSRWQSGWFYGRFYAFILVFSLVGGTRTHVDALNSGVFGGASLLSRASQSLTSTFRARNTFQLTMSVPLLDKWKLLPNGSVIGTVTNHPAIDDGDVITTSPIVDPSAARSQSVIQTATGSRYKLLSPIQKANFSVDPPPQSSSGLGLNGISQFLTGSQPVSPLSDSSMSMSSPTAPSRETDPWREAVQRYKLTAATIGLDDEYLLAGKPVRSTSGKSKIWEAYRSDPRNDGLPTSDPPVCVKISSNLEAVAREYENYRKINFLGMARGRFVKCYEFFPVAGYGKSFRNQCALVLEMGARDLKSFLNQRGLLQGKELRDAAISAAQCLQALHSAGLVWTDLKTENFVVMPNGEVKGIDLESAMPLGDNPVDYSPEACPPEFAEAFLSGDGPYFQLDYSYDVWSLGMMLLELATGRGYFDGKNPAQITKILRDSPNPVPIDDIECGNDEKLKDLMKRCLQRDPKLRPRMSQVMMHPYFMQSPFSVFSF